MRGALLKLKKVLFCFFMKIELCPQGKNQLSEKIELCPQYALLPIFA
jgi:hypothetical protein